MRQGLTELQRRFVAQYRGQGDATRAAKAAGYRGTATSIQVTASKLLKNRAVKAAIEEKFEKLERERRAKLAKAAKRGGRSVGTLAERLELLMAIARDPQQHARDRTRAIYVAGELAGERGRGRFDPVPVKPTAATAAPGDAARELSEVRVPARLIVVGDRNG